MSEQTNKTTAMNLGGEIRWGGMKTTTYFVVLGIVLAATFTKNLPGGWLGGYNFQWAWASAFACAQALPLSDHPAG